MTDKAPPGPSLAQLRALIAVADAGGFGEAAAEHGVSQSSLSEAVAKLETLAGRALLRRTPGGTLPTDAGARALDHARAAVQAAADALLAAQDEAGGLSGRLRVVSFRSIATHLLPPALAAFRRSHPNVAVSLLDSEAGGGGIRAVRSGRADLAVVTVDEGAELALTPLVSDEYVFVAPASRGAAPVSLAELAGTALLLPPARDSCHRRVRSYLAARGVPLTGIQEIEQDSVTLSMVGHGLGVSVMPRLALLPLPAGLVAVPLPEPLHRPLALAALPHRAGLPVIRAFTAAVLAHLPTQSPGSGAERPHPPVAALPLN